MKKIWGVLILVLLVLNLVSSALDLDKNKEDFENVRDNIDDVRGLADADKWDYLGGEWESILLNNKGIVLVDGFFKKINIIFVVVFGENYKLSLTLFFAIILWFFFFLHFSYILRSYSTFDDVISWLVSFFFTVSLSQFGFFHFLGSLIFKLIFFKEGIWGFLGFLIFFIVLGILARMLRNWGKYVRDSLEKKEKEQEKIDRLTLRGTAKAAKKINDALQD